MAATRADSPAEYECGVVLGLGSNLGQPREQLRRALAALQGRHGGAQLVSGLYRSAPVGPEQPDFLNAAVLLEFPGDLHDLLDLTSALESEFGRERLERWGPRTLDIDLLWAGPRVIQSPRLSVPHPRLAERAFAVLPLLDVCPRARDPASGAAYAELLPGFHSQRIERVEEPGWFAK